MAAASSSGEGAAAPPPLLHNMSMRPATTVKQDGVSRCLIVTCDLAASAMKSRGRASPASAWLAALGVPLRRGQSAERVLLERLEGVLEPLGLPPVVPLLPNAQGEQVPGLSDRLDVALAIAARSTGRAFVAHRDPVLPDPQRVLTLSLVLPEDWRLP